MEARAFAAIMLAILMMIPYIAAVPRAGWNSDWSSRPVELIIPYNVPQQVNSTVYYEVRGDEIYMINLTSGEEKRINLFGVNWFGFETPDHVVHGLWARNWEDMLLQIKSLGFNAIRLPFCTESVQPGTVPTSIDYNKNPDLQGLTSLEIMEKIVQRAGELGIFILLDYHRIGCQYIEPLWYTDTFTEQDYINTWVSVAQRFSKYWNVIGADLKNEPHSVSPPPGAYTDGTGATWGMGNNATDWNLAAERIGRAILQVAPHWLIFVEGTQYTRPDIDGSYQWGYNSWWGGNLMAVRDYPVNLPRNKLVYSPHVYGPDVYNQPYFNEPNFPDNMPDIWYTHFGYVKIELGYPVVIGEFGGRYGHGGDPRDVAWQNKLIDWMIENNFCSFFYWSWNPNSGDTGGILQDDWTNIWQDKYQNLKRLMDYCSQSGLPQVALVANATTVSPGESVMVNWSIANADGWDSNIATSQAGSTVITVNQTVTLYIHAWNVNGSVNKTLTITVEQGQDQPSPPPFDVVEIIPTTLQYEGVSSTVTCDGGQCCSSIWGCPNLWGVVRIGNASIDPNLWGWQHLYQTDPGQIGSGTTTMWIESGVLQVDSQWIINSMPQYNVMGYHEVIYGAKPWGNQPVNAPNFVLPAMISNLPRLLVGVHYNQYSGVPGNNYAFEAWLFPDTNNNRAPGPGDYEIMVQLYIEGGFPAGYENGPVAVFEVPLLVNGTLVNQTFELYDVVADPGWRFLTFKSTSNYVNSSVVFDYTYFIELADQYLGGGLDNLYLMSLEFGTEVYTNTCPAFPCDVDIRWSLEEYYYALAPRSLTPWEALAAWAGSSQPPSDQPGDGQQAPGSGYFNLYVDFQNRQPGPYTETALQEDFIDINWSRLDGRATIAEEAGNKYLRIEYPAGQAGSRNSGASFVVNLPESQYCRLDYLVRFEDGFDFSKGGKLPGLTSGGSQWTGFRVPSNGEGWSARFMWRGDKTPDWSNDYNRSDAALFLYLYWMNQQNSYGDYITLNYTVVPGVWYKISQEIYVGTAGQANAYIIVYINDTMLLNMSNIQLRGDGQRAYIDSFYFSTFFGGSSSNWAPNHTVYADFDEINITCTPVNETTQPGSPPTVTLVANTTSITAGEPVQLQWTVIGADGWSSNIPGIGAVPSNGSTVVSPSTTTTYYIYVWNSYGDANATVTIQVASGGGQGSGAVTIRYPDELWPTAEIDLDGDGYNEYVIEINPWNIDSADGYAEMIFYPSNGTLHYVQALDNIVLRNPGSWVHGYPEIFYGNKPWNQYNATDGPVQLPARVTDLNNFYVTVSYRLNPEPGLPVNLAIESWLTRDQWRSTGIQYNEQEVMIWLYYDGLQPAGSKVGEIVVPIIVNGTEVNATFEVWKAFIGWEYIAFRITTPIKAGTVTLPYSPFISTAANITDLTDYTSLYLEDVEVGTEYGSPSTTSAHMEWWIYQFNLTPTGDPLLTTPPPPPPPGDGSGGGSSGGSGGATTGSLEVTLVNSWGSGAHYEVAVTLDQASEWSLLVKVANGYIDNSWGAVVNGTTEDGYIVLVAEQWNLGPTATAGFITGGQNPLVEEVLLVVNDQVLDNWTAPQPSPGSLEVSLVIDSDWNTGFVARIYITNVGDTPVSGWYVKIYMTSTINSIWGANAEYIGNNTYVLTPVGYTSVIDPGETIEIGFVAEKQGDHPYPEIVDYGISGVASGVVLAAMLALAARARSREASL